MKKRNRAGIVFVVILAAWLGLYLLNRDRNRGEITPQTSNQEDFSGNEVDAGAVTNIPGSGVVSDSPLSTSPISSFTSSSDEEFPIRHEVTLEDDLTLTLRMEVDDPGAMVPKSYERLLAGLDPEIVGNFVGIELLGRNGEDLTASPLSPIHYNHDPSMVPLRAVVYGGIGKQSPLATELPVTIESLDLASQYELSLVDFISVIKRKLSNPEYRQALQEGSKFRLHFNLTSPSKGKGADGNAKVALTKFQSDWIELSPVNLEYLHAYLDSDY